MTHEKENTLHFFVDYKVVFDSPIRDSVFGAISELVTTAKLIRLLRMTLSNCCSSVNVEMEYSAESVQLLAFAGNIHIILVPVVLLNGSLRRWIW